MTELSPDDQRSLIQALRERDRYPHPCSGIQVIETHISTVILTGPFAYKIKKPLNLGFLDFSTLDRRRHCCEEEIRLNSRLAPGIYLDVVPISGSPAEPKVGGRRAPIEYAVRMRQFDPSSMLGDLLARGELPPGRIDEIAGQVARFHDRAAIAAPDGEFGTPPAVFGPALENFEQLRPLVSDPGEAAQLARLEAWSHRRFESLHEVFAGRLEAGHVRECHGDMHLGNMALVDGAVAIFDGIEFNANLRWIDVMSEIAFLVMDLDDRGRTADANRALNLYLEHTGDYGGLAVLDFYKVYRALVRAKVLALRLSQDIDARTRRDLHRDYLGYLRLAERYTAGVPRALLITHGLSGSGKSTIAGGVVERYGAIRLRSDVERKRLQGVDAGARTGAGLGQGIYDEAATRATYGRLADLAETVLQAGYPAIVDATFLQRWQRNLFSELARRLEVPMAILDIEVPLDTLKGWIAKRQSTGRDASEADFTVVEAQIAGREPLADNELSLARPIRADSADLAAALDGLLTPAT